jgi:hypothetical protein
MNIKTMILAGILSVLLCIGLIGCGDDEKAQQEQEKEESLVKSGVTAAVSGAVSVTKDVASGITEGLDEGRKSGSSTDDAVIVTEKQDFQKYVGVEVLKVEELQAGEYQITLAFKNDLEKPIRLTNLDEAANVVLLDVDGFSYNLDQIQGQDNDVTLIAKSSTRIRLVFKDLELPPATLRLYQVDLELPAPVKAAQAPTEVESSNESADTSAQ